MLDLESRFAVDFGLFASFAEFRNNFDETLLVGAFDVPLFWLSTYRWRSFVCASGAMSSRYSQRHCSVNTFLSYPP